MLKIVINVPLPAENSWRREKRMLEIVKNVPLPAENSWRREKRMLEIVKNVLRKMDINDVVFLKNQKETVAARQFTTRLGYKVIQRRISATEIGLWRVA
jgi:hypothetical protein